MVKSLSEFLKNVPWQLGGTLSVLGINCVNECKTDRGGGGCLEPPWNRLSLSKRGRDGERK